MRFLLLSLFFFLHQYRNCFGALRTDQQYWNDLAQNELEEALRVKWNLNTAKNVIIFIGDGMGPNTVTATRIYRGGETHRLVYEKFPHMGLLKPYAADKMVPDSASTATAMFCGVKINVDTLGVDASVKFQDCNASLVPETRLESLASLASAAGKSTGFVTTMRVTHATPGPLYAHSASRNWECETMMPPEAQHCKDIARQLVEDEPGRSLNVIMGGGRIGLVSTSEVSTNPWSCQRRDGRDLIQFYKNDKESRGLKYAVVSNNEELRNVNYNETDYLMGIFADSHLSYEHERNSGPDGSPSISDMTEAAIRVLRRNDNGFFLMVEGGNIDMAHHRGRAKVAISEAAALEAAVGVAISLTDEQDTLIIVTSDHTHTLSINGYPDRGSNIFGLAGAYEGANYTTLSYGTGGPGSLQHYVRTGSPPTVARRDAALDDTDSWEYEQISAIQLVENSHGGGDVTIYARGPHAHLFHSVHEQHYVFHAAARAAGLRGRGAALGPPAAIALLLLALLTCAFH